MSGLEDCPLNNVVGSINLCDGENAVAYDFYGYNVKLWISALFVSLFGLALLVHIFQAVRGRIHYALATIVLCLVGEVIGWGARVWSSTSVEWQPELGGHYYSNRSAFMAQIASLILSPAFLSAFAYILLGRLMLLLVPQYARFNPKSYAIVFVTGDVISLAIQAAGGGSAAGAETSDEADQGARIMVAGVLIQSAILVLFSLILVDFVIAYLRKSPVKQLRLRRTTSTVVVPAGSVPPQVERKARLLVLALVVNTIFVFTRGMFRTVELLDGWDGKLATDETLFTILDALMILLACLVFNIVHPSAISPQAWAGQVGQGTSLDELNGEKQAATPQYHV